MEKKIDTTEVKKALRARGFSSGHLDEFCRLLADRLGESITPLGFLLVYSLLVSDVEKSPGRNVINGPGGKEQESHIGGLAIGPIFNMMMPMVVKKVFPADFAEDTLGEMKSVLNEVKARM
jgi:hypothetical protein